MRNVSVAEIHGLIAAGGKAHGSIDNGQSILYAPACI